MGEDMSIKRQLAGIVERVIGARIVRAWDIALLFEEEHLSRFFTHFDVDCVFDVGANSGQYATMLRQRVGYRGPIISFEPIPEAAADLRERAGREGRWFVEEVALGVAPGRATFNIMADNKFSSLHQPQTNETDLVRSGATISRRVEVRTSTLAQELTKYQDKLLFKRPFLKMDTQGHDLNVALGAGKQLKEFIGLQSELAIKRIYADAPGYEEALTFYRENGFTLSAFVPNNLGHFPYLIETDCIMFRE
jgi:FkbM family methyltransferase